MEIYTTYHVAISSPLFFLSVMSPISVVATDNRQVLEPIARKKTKTDAPVSRWIHAMCSTLLRVTKTVEYDRCMALP